MKASNGLTSFLDGFVKRSHEISTDRSARLAHAILKGFIKEAIIAPKQIMDQAVTGQPFVETGVTSGMVPGQEQTLSMTPNVQGMENQAMRSGNSPEVDEIIKPQEEVIDPLQKIIDEQLLSPQTLPSIISNILSGGTV